jgi:excisionase family DNA binding protein
METPTEKTDREPMLKCSDIARMLNISEIGVRRYIQQRAIPFYKIGGNIRFNLSEINQWIQEHQNTVSAINGDKEE